MPSRWAVRFISSAKFSIEPGYHAAGGYAGGLVLQRAIEQAGSIDQEKVAAVLNKMDATTLFGRTKFSTDPKEHGLQSKLQAEVVRRGLVVRLLTDNVLFASGSAQLEPGSTGLLTTLGRLLAAEVRHPIVVEGHTDNRPIASAQFPTNWELSTSRATQVVRFFIRQRVAASRLQAAGLAAQRPIASNSNDSGRSRNRRVEIVLTRQNSDPSTSTSSP